MDALMCVGNGITVITMIEVAKVGVVVQNHLNNYLHIYAFNAVIFAFSFWVFLILQLSVYGRLHQQS